MTNAIPFGDWLDEQGDNVRLTLCDGHPETLILVDMTDMNVYRYVIDKDMDGLSEAMGELMRMRVQDLGIEVV